MRIASLSGILLITLASACGSGGSSPSAAQEAAAAAVPAGELRSAAKDQSVERFYEARQWQAAWNDAAERQLRQALANRAAHGLGRVAFLKLESGASPATREAGLTAAALDYASALAKGWVDPNELREIYTVERPKADVAAGLDQALRNGRVGAWLNGLAPQSTEYKAISEAYLKWRKAASQASGGELEASGLIHVGDQDPRVPRIAQALARNGYLAEPGEPSDTYDDRLASAVRDFQRDFGIAVDGVVGSNTIEALNTGADDKARAAAVALERRRWLERDPPATRIDVNIADATLEYVRDGKVVDRRKVIVGQPDKNTPQLGTAMYRLVANPTWTVPRSIQHSELAGLSNAELHNRNMEWRDGWIVEKSGPGNALGLVKFDLKDEYAIYLHDTPSKPLFDHNRRQLSHGCIRVANALDFAQMIARDEGITDKWQQARQKSGETFVPLPKDIPVRLLYHPTYVTPAGEVVVQQDVYDWNQAVAEKLGFGTGRSEKFKPALNDIGP
jgi:murein L,D-transpeptidase YcbB/YkuD